MHEDRLEQRADVEPAVELAQRLHGRRRGRRRDEVAPELGDHERGVRLVADDELHAVLPAVLAALAVDLLDARVVQRLVVAEVPRAGVRPVVAKAGQRPRELAHVLLAVAAIGPEAEQLLQLTRVVLVRRPLVVRRAVEPQQHRRVLRHVQGQLLEVAERVPAQQRVLAQHQPLGDARLRGREPVVPDERHPLDQRRLRAHHAIEPPQVIVAPRVARRERRTIGARRRPDQPRRSRPRQRLDSATQPQLGQLRRLTRRRPETRTPQQPRRLLFTERPPIDRNPHTHLHRHIRPNHQGGSDPFRDSCRTSGSDPLTRQLSRFGVRPPGGGAPPRRPPCGGRRRRRWWSGPSGPCCGTA